MYCTCRFTNLWQTLQLTPDSVPCLWSPSLIFTCNIFTGLERNGAETELIIKQLTINKSYTAEWAQETNAENDL